MHTTSINTKLTISTLSPAIAVETLTVLYDLRWAIASIAVLVFCDFWFGVTAALRRGEHFRFSRAGRRTFNKLVDYICYLMVGAVMGLAIFEPYDIATHTQTAGLCIGCAAVFEIDSIIDHICEMHGIRKRFSFKRFIIHLLKRTRPAVGEALEDSITKSDKNEKD